MCSRPTHILNFGKGVTVSYAFVVATLGQYNEQSFNMTVIVYELSTKVQLLTNLSFGSSGQ